MDPASVNHRQRLALSLVDQGAVSAGNFLLVALGAQLLPVHEQGKLVYGYTAYIGLVLLNIALYFAVAPVVRTGLSEPGCYRSALFRSQMASALLSSGLVIAVFHSMESMLAWRASPVELVSLFAFLFLQQLADFHRRAGYVFERIGASMAGSLVGLAVRFTAIILVRPGDAAAYFFILALTALPGAVWALLAGIPPRDEGCPAAVRHALLRSHVGLSKWNVLNAPLMWCGLHLPILLAGALHSKEAAAVLGSIRAITTFVNVALELLETLVPAWLATKFPQGGMAAIRAAEVRMLVIGGGVWLSGALAILVGGEAILSLVLGDQYARHAPALLVIWLGNGVYFVGRVIGLHYRMARKTFMEMLGSVGGLFALLLCLPIIAAHGALGGAWSLFFVQVGVVVAFLGYRWVVSLRQAAPGR
jgi:hypothetical protein